MGFQTQPVISPSKKQLPTTFNPAKEKNSTYGDQNSKATTKYNSLCRFSNTAAALQEAGLMEVTVESAKLIRENEQLQKAIDALQEETLQLSKLLQVQLLESIKAAKRQNIASS